MSASINKIQTINDIKVIIDEDIAKPDYVNYLRVTHSLNEFILDFACVAPDSYNKPTARVVKRLLISSNMIKDVINTLNTNVAKFETTFGVKLPNNPADILKEKVVG